MSCMPTKCALRVPTRLHDLAVLGAAPAFVERLHVGRPNLGNRGAFLRRIEQIWDSGILTNNGPMVQELERKLADLLGVTHCLAICNGTVALEIATRALGMRGEVIVPAFTFVATVHALQWQGFHPVFCDVDPNTHTIEPARVERLITPRTTGIVPVHLWGRACDTEGLERIARKHGLALVFDAAHALGCSHGGQMIGSFGDAEVFSFHATKVLGTFEGGAIATNNDALAAKISLMRNFGFAGYDRVIYPGINGKMCEASAAMGLTALESLADFIGQNQQNCVAYQEALGGIPGLSLIRHDPRERHNFQYVVVDVDAGRAGLTRDEIVAVLHAENVLARRYFSPGVHRMEPYASLSPGRHWHLPVTEALCDRLLCLPTGMSVGAADIAAIGAILRLALAHAADVHQRLEANVVRIDSLADRDSDLSSDEGVVSRVRDLPIDEPLVARAGGGGRLTL
jgi:dTDP-4-amino-4,6-dideoxygalactose transaminase